MSAGMIIAMIITVLLLWLVIGGMVAALLGPLLKEQASRISPSREGHVFSESAAGSVSKT